MITALIQFKLPQPLSREKASEIFSDTAPKYRGIQGLIRKYYVLSQDGGTAGPVGLRVGVQYLLHGSPPLGRVPPVEALAVQIPDALALGGGVALGIRLLGEQEAGAPALLGGLVRRGAWRRKAVAETAQLSGRLGAQARAQLPQSLGQPLVGAGPQTARRGMP